MSAQSASQNKAVFIVGVLSNRVFKSYDDIVDHRCYAWNTLIAQPWKIMSIGLREWAYIGRLI
jgi:hypothetical protein